MRHRKSGLKYKPRVFNVEKETERFWLRVDKSGGPDACWPWVKSRNEHGYGYTNWGSHATRAHRLAYTLTYGPVPKGLHVLHRCDNPPCVNPSHLFLGTHQDNMTDMKNKRRYHAMYGEQCPSHKLTEHEARLILELASQHKKTRRELAEMFNVSKSTVASLLRRETWRWLSDQIEAKGQ